MTFQPMPFIGLDGLDRFVTWQSTHGEDQNTKQLSLLASAEQMLTQTFPSKVLPQESNI